MHLVSDKETERCGKMIMKKYNIKNVLVTRGDKGLSRLPEKSHFILLQYPKKFMMFPVLEIRYWL